MRRLLAITLVLGAALLGAPEADPQGIGAVVVADGLAFPAAFTFAPDGRIFYGERGTGEIHIFDASTGSDTLFFKVSNVVHRVQVFHIKDGKVTEQWLHPWDAYANDDFWG